MKNYTQTQFNLVFIMIEMQEKDILWASLYLSQGVLIMPKPHLKSEQENTEMKIDLKVLIN